MLHFESIPDTVRNLLTLLAPVETLNGPDWQRVNKHIREKVSELS